MLLAHRMLQKRFKMLKMGSFSTFKNQVALCYQLARNWNNLKTNCTNSETAKGIDEMHSIYAERIVITDSVKCCNNVCIFLRFVAKFFSYMSVTKIWNVDSSLILGSKCDGENFFKPPF